MNGKKYLDSEKVIKLLRKDLICKYPTTFAHGLWAAADEIAKMDGEDVRPVKRGKWLAASRLVVQPTDTDHNEAFWKLVMPPDYKPGNARLVVSALCDCCSCWHVEIHDAGCSSADYDRKKLPLPWFCPNCGADMRPKEDNDG